MHDVGVALVGLAIFGGVLCLLGYFFDRLT